MQESNPPQIIDSRYEVGRVIGRGGFAIVYEAVDLRELRPVALKLLADEDPDPVVSARLEREARAALAIKHPNVCTTLYFGRLDDGRAFLAMELLDGETLRTYLRRKHRLDAEEAIEICVQILSGLEAAHLLGVVHRDIKPENVFVSWADKVNEKRPNVKILDFGVCRHTKNPLDAQTLTMTGFIIGTPGYCAPEQAYGERSTDPRVDIFAVGVVLFELLTGSQAFPTKSTMELAAALANPIPSARSLLGSLPAMIDRIIARATDPEPQRRYATAAEFQRELLDARTAIRAEKNRIRAMASALEASDDGRGTTDFQTLHVTPADPKARRR